MSKPTEKKPTSQYTIKRIGSGYAVYKNDLKISEENMLDIAFATLKRFIRKDLGL